MLQDEEWNDPKEQKICYWVPGDCVFKIAYSREYSSLCKLNNQKFQVQWLLNIGQSVRS